MELELSDDQVELRDNVRTVLEGACGTDVVRALHEGDGTEARSALWTQFAELYWPALGITEDQGGLGMSFVETALLAEELGRATAPGPLLATVTQFVPLVREAATAAGSDVAPLLAAVAEGSCRATMAWAEHDRYDLDAVTTTARADGDRWVLDGTKHAVLDAPHVDRLAVVARAPGTSGDDGLGVFVVDADAAGLDIEARSGLDATQPLADVTFTGVSVDGDRVIAAPGTAGVVDALDRALQEATVAMACAGVGACRRIFELTLEYAKVREQYDQVIGSFQALKHRLADMYLAVERANSVAYYAALTIAEDDPRRAEAAHLAKAAAGDCQRLLAQDGLQLHGGIGYTWEHDLHFWLKRAKSCELLCGTSAWHRSRLAASLGLTGQEAA